MKCTMVLVGVLVPGITLLAGTIEILKAGSFEEMKNVTGTICVSLNDVTAARQHLTPKEDGYMMKKYWDGITGTRRRRSRR